jgi:hypothetical protein
VTDPTSGNPGELILYRTDDGRSIIQLRAVDGTVWLTQAQIADLLDTGVPNINKHIASIIEDGELLEERTISHQEIVRQEGSRLVRRRIQSYNLDMILAVGYRVRSMRGIQFRQWATTTLREYLIKGFIMDDERLKDPGGFDYFDELLERIREIRASEKRFYQKVREIFATAVDYNPATETARTFFATIQNKLVFAVTGHTAAELVLARADGGKANMGLTSWSGSRVRKADVTISKNYLFDNEMAELNRLTTMFLDTAEDRARRRRQTTMADWADLTDRFLTFNEREILTGAGSVSSADMKRVASERYAAFEGERHRRELDASEREAMAELAEIEQRALNELGPSST